MKRLLLRAGIGFGVIFATAIIALCAYVYRVCLAHFDHVEAVLATLPAAEAGPPEAFTRAVRALDSDTYSSWVARSFVVETAPERLSMLDWHLRNSAWGFALRRRLSEAQLLSLYAHFIPFEGGRGLAYGSRHYFSRDPSALDLRQVVELLVISRAPAVYSAGENSERLRSQVERLLARLDT